jgi:hypothetical protein
MGGAKIEMDGFCDGRERSYNFRGELVIGKLISGLADNTSDCWWPQRDAIELAELKCAISLRAERRRLTTLALCQNRGGTRPRRSAGGGQLHRKDFNLCVDWVVSAVRTQRRPS